MIICPVCDGLVAAEPGGPIPPHSRYAEGSGPESDKPHNLVPCTGCRLDETTTWAGFRARLVIPLRTHEPGDCLIQLIKHDEEGLNDERQDN